MIIIKVKIKFRDDKVKEYICNDNPGFGAAWLTLYTLRGKKSLERIILPMEGIAEITYWYENKTKKIHKKRDRGVR